MLGSIIGELFEALAAETSSVQMFGSITGENFEAPPDPAKVVAFLSPAKDNNLSLFVRALRPICAAHRVFPNHYTRSTG